MSTRCNIILRDENKNKKIYLYHHHDGYPEGVGADLAHFVSVWNKCYYYCIEEIATIMIKGLESPLYGRVDNEYELTSGLHGDIEYLYIVRLEWDDEAKKNTIVLEAYSVCWPDEYAMHADTLTAIDGTICRPISLTEKQD